MLDFFFKHPGLFRWLMNLWPPFWFPGIRVVHISHDYLYACVDLKWRPWTRNINGAQYGGSLFSMTDPMLALMLYGILGHQRYHIWDKSAEIDYIKPGIGRLTAEFRISEAQLSDIRQHTAEGEKCFPEFVVYIKDARGEVVCKATRRLYVRLKSAYRPMTSE